MGAYILQAATIKGPNGDKMTVVEKKKKDCENKDGVDYGLMTKGAVERKAVKVDPGLKKLAILGTAETMVQCPTSDDWEIWACSTCLNVPGFQRANYLFEIHHYDGWKERTAQINETKIPVYTITEVPEVPLAKKYPLEEMIQKFGRRYFTNTIAYMFALAIAEGFQHVAVFGVHLATSDEWQYERPCNEYWLGRMEGLGINVWIPKESELLHAPRMYGYEHSEVLPIIEQRLAQYSHERDRIAAEIERGKEAYFKYCGAAEVAKYFKDLHM
jgi:hypothetical protein